MKLKLAILHLLICTVISAQDKSTFKGSEDNIEYKAIFDGKNVYLTLRTEFKMTMQAMLHRGYTIYFDVKGKKKKNVSIQYPVKKERLEKGTRPERGERSANGEQNGPDINKILENLSKMANYTSYDSSQDFNLDLNNLGIAMNYSYEESTEEGPILEYHLKIPASKIVKENEDLSKLSIGIVATEQAEKENNQQSNMGRSGRQGGGQGGRSRGSGGGRGGAGNGGGSQQGRETTQQASIDFWFHLNDKKK
ncbi:hypothetical protein MWU65_06525 [Cellulophaga sp. F20128]|uniref:hypothetical protein n=1 Tax=Cellulophaga sp. F20128 TaxID=2926413 RepID=UPI001FF3D55F|nr:hypothetical protein [Cellulophaga sp. F20128]MCK0156827.1 hypothetical protein [Cellulophaga sp. F20128]